MSRNGVAQIDRGDEKGARAAERLETSRVLWMTTVNPDGTPQVSPVWYLWDGGVFLMYSLESSRVRNLATHGRVALNLDGNGMGGDIVVVEGTARIDRSAPSAADNDDYLAKYRPVMDARGWTPEWFAGRYSVPVVIAPTKYRYW
jgi:PPOX class probable F420-dependent enzyme